MFIWYLGRLTVCLSLGFSSKDVLAYVTCIWLLALDSGNKIGVYCSDIKGAFDRVSTDKLLSKCAAYGLPEKATNFLRAYLAPRTAHVVVGGVSSDAITLENQVFQGSVSGPKLWNIYFSDIRFVVQLLGFIELLFADDLNAFKIYQVTITNEDIVSDLKACQSACHDWGGRNQIEFEQAKESFTVLHRRDPCGSNFKLLGAMFDTSLSMQPTFDVLKKNMQWRLRALYKLRKFYSEASSETFSEIHGPYRRGGF